MLNFRGVDDKGGDDDDDDDEDDESPSPLTCKAWIVVPWSLNS